MNAPPAGKWTMVVLQVLVWIVFYLLLLLYTSHKWDNPHFGILNASIATSSYLVAVYVHAFFLLPRFFYARRTGVYIFASLLFLLLLVMIRMSFEKELLLPIHKQFYAFQWAHASFTIITILVAFLFGALLRVLLNYFQLVRVKNELQEKHQAAQLDLLKAQVQPHFLFNTLNNIYSLAQQRSEKTPEMIARLSQLMRYFIDEAPRRQVALATELMFVNNYIDLEQIRMVHPVEVEWQVEADIKAIDIPPMLLIPFIENVFKHGVDKLHSRNCMRIRLALHENNLHYEVRSSLDEAIREGSGSGLKNLKSRLELLYGTKYELTCKKEGGLFNAFLQIPLR